MNVLESPENEIFLSTPVSSFEPEEFSRFKALFNSLSKIIERKTPGYRVFCAAEGIASLNQLEDSKYSAITDFQRIQSCAGFVLFYPKPLATSALVELGFALALEKRILIITPAKVHLPFLCRKLDMLYDFVEIQVADINGANMADLISEFIDRKVLTRP